MRLVHLFIIATLLAVPMISISTASAQNSTSIYAQNDVTLDVNTGKGHIVITGSVYKLFSYPVVLKIQSPNGTLIAVSQLKPASDGTFSLSISPSAPLWSAQGNYIITVSSDSQEIGKTTFYFNGTNLSSAPHGINTMGRLLPLEQLNTGTAANDVKCNDGLQLIIKAEDGSPACVRKETASALILRGWASQILTTETVSQANSNQTSGDVPDFKIGPYTLRLAPHQLVFFMKSNSSAKIFVEYTSRLPNTGTMNSWSRVYIVNATNYTPLTTSDVAISASPLSIPLTEGSDTTVVYTVTAKEGIKGVYWLSLAQFCGLMPIAIDIDSSHLSPSDIPVFTGSRSCPAQMLDAKILGISGGTAEYRIGQPIP